MNDRYKMPRKNTVSSSPTVGGFAGYFKNGITNSVNISNIQDLKGLIIPGTLFNYNSSSGYSNDEDLHPGSGYWLHANNSGNIFLTNE